MDAVDKIAVKENRPTGLTFKNHANESFAFSNHDLDKQLIERPTAPYPDIPNELPGVTAAVTVLAPPPPQGPEDLADIAAANAGIDLNDPPFIVKEDNDVPMPINPNVPMPINPNDDDVVPIANIAAIPPAAPNQIEPMISDTDTIMSASDNNDDTSDNNDDDAPPAHVAAPPAPAVVPPASTTGWPTCTNAGSTTRFNDYHMFVTADKDDLHIDEDTITKV